jgi:hypothetical protein
MTGYWNAYKIHISMQLAMVLEIAMVIEIISRKWKQPSMPPSQDMPHSKIADFTAIGV